ncbi:MAG: fumarylacetoacetate hydrolase family protein [Panacagrimonas sp.]
MNLVFPAATTPTLSIVGSDARFPVNRIFCVGRNYAAHAREMGQDEREPPFFFMKPASAAVDASGPTSIPYPSMTSNFHHEIELVVAIGKSGSAIPIEQALEFVFGYAVGLDMTRRDLQFQARDKGRPWEFGKSFTASAPIGAISRASEIGHLKAGAISVAVNDKTKQSSDIGLMIWNVAESIAYLSRYEALQAGDLIMTGTPEGVGPAVAGDEMRGQIEGLQAINVKVG